MEREREERMGDVAFAWCSRLASVNTARDERGTTAIDWVMVVALCLSAVVLVLSFGGAWAGNA